MMESLEKMLQNHLMQLGGFYKTPMKDGWLQGPIVGYAKRYKDTDGVEKQMVGFDYVNCAVLESNAPCVLRDIAMSLAELVREKLYKTAGESLVFCGAPEGGKALAYAMSLHTNHDRYVFPEKETVALATETSRAKTRIFFGRHQLEEGEEVVLVEDLLNNFSTVGEILPLIIKAKARLVAITALFNRSEGRAFAFNTDQGIVPVIAAITQPMKQYRQDDPEVAEEIKKGNFVPKPKSQWSELLAVMGAAGEI